MRLLEDARSLRNKPQHPKGDCSMNSGPVNATCDPLLTAIDLTRACCANDDYLLWLSHYSDALHGSAGIANYLANSASAFEEQAHPQIRADFDAFDARDNLADILMASAPLSTDELRMAVMNAICEAKADSSQSFPVLVALDGRNGYSRKHGSEVGR
jgi:hypothetical protein